MSTIKWFPGSLTGAQSTDGDGKVSFDTDGSIFIERRWVCRYQDAFTLCPKPRDFAPAGTPGTNTRCITSGYERQKPDAAIISATYQGIWNMPFTVYQLDAARGEHPITYHPNFSNTSLFGTYVGDSTPGLTKTKIAGSTVDPTTGQKAWTFEKFRDIGTPAEIKFRGVTHYLVATAVWRKTSYTLTPVFGVSGLFKIDGPDTGGLWTVADANQWLKADKTFRNLYRGASEIWEIQESWLYNANGWLTEIYG
jgi:hypothetical protein